MLPNILSDDFNQVEQVVLMYSNVYVERYEEEILTPNRANIKIRLRFHQTHLLEINEAIVVANNQLQFLDYRYHFQNEHNYLIFRYDSTPHFPNLPNFPYHKHLPDDVIAADKPEISQVLKEANGLLSK
ncbi:toxin TumE [Dolichospermum flos-aquae]|uniref:Uncharacterized protein n=1 Tax=Dolichospermum flos-aquae LEGE 04289 TaxID=1828708 RepID=A0ACC5Q600_DOLFA|nr:DUF6516 family protein [Dolichospermum flos-aquae]MBE9220803.1 hypothetical protein [Dolichospermum flos-aquae LEGE 04289]